MAIVYRSYDDLNKTIDDLIESINSLDSSNVYEIGGWTVINEEEQGTASLASPGDFVVIDSANKRFYITSVGDGTFTEKGIQLDYNSGDPRFYVGDGATAYLNFDGTKLTWSAANSSLDASGNLVVTGATIGGWVVGNTTIADSNTRIVLDSSNEKITIGDTTFGNAGIQLDANAGSPQLYVGDGANQYFQYVTGSGISWKGTNTSLTTGGSFTASNANITGTITASDGRIANWYINTDTISSAEVENDSMILLDSANSIIRVGKTSGETPKYITLDGENLKIWSNNYTPGPFGAGFTLEPDLLEVGNIRARGILHSTIFEYDVVSCVGGDLMVSDGGTLNEDMGPDDTDTTLKSWDNNRLAVNDILYLKDPTHAEYVRVTSIIGAPDYEVTRDLAGDYADGSNPEWPQGTTFVKLGSSNGADTYSGGWLYMLGEGTNSPYYAVVKRTGVAHDAYTEYARLGNLNGFLDYAADEYGIAIGEANNNLKYDPTNGFGITAGGGNVGIDSLGINLAYEYEASPASVRSLWWKNSDDEKVSYIGSNENDYAVGDKVNEINIWVTSDPGTTAVEASRFKAQAVNNAYSAKAWVECLMEDLGGGDYDAIAELYVDPHGSGTGSIVLTSTGANDYVAIKNSTAGSELRFYDAGLSNYVGFASPALTANQIWVLPDADGDANDFLQTDGGGNLTWAAESYSTDNWDSFSQTCTYASADDPTYTFTISGDYSAVFTVGTKLQLTQSSTVKYFIVSKDSSYSSPNTTVTIYGGTDYDLANSAISDVSYSYAKCPAGFPVDATKWDWQTTDTTDRAYTPATAGTVYNPGSISLSVPIGVWTLGFEAIAQIGYGGAASGQKYMNVGLSTANNSYSDAELKTSIAGAASEMVRGHVQRSKNLTLTTKTAYYLNDSCDGSNQYIYILGSSCGTTLVKATCRLL